VPERRLSIQRGGNNILGKSTLQMIKKKTHEEKNNKEGEEKKGERFPFGLLFTSGGEIGFVKTHLLGKIKENLPTQRAGEGGFCPGEKKSLKRENEPAAGEKKKEPAS